MVIAEITYCKKGHHTTVERFRTHDYYSIYDCLMKITNGNHELSSDAASWCELACIDEEYDVEEFNIKIMEIE